MSLTDKTVRLWTLTFVSWFNHGRVFNKFKPLKIRIKMIFNEFLLQRKLSFIRVYTEVIYFGGFFGAFPAIFPPFKQVWSLGFLWSSLRYFWSVFYVWFFKMEFNPLPDLLNTGFTIIEIGLFYGGEHLGAKICRFLTFLTRSLQDGDFWSVLNRGWRRVKTLQILVEFFLCFIKTLNLLSKGNADKF